jgi:hypothetical protein
MSPTVILSCQHLPDFPYPFKNHFTSSTKEKLADHPQTTVMETLQTLTIRRDIRRLKTLYERALQEDLPLETLKPIVIELRSKMQELDLLLEQRVEDILKQKAKKHQER